MNLQQILELNDYSMEVLENRLKVARYVCNRLTEPSVIAVIDWTGDRDCGICEEYFYMVKSIWEQATSFSNSCSSGYHSDMKFLSDYILAIATQNFELEMVQRERKIKKLQRELDNLRGE